jgi:hypothetical protein
MPVEVKGVVDLRKALKNYSPDLAKALPKEIGSFLKPVVKAAKSYVPYQSPLSGWTNTRSRFPAFESKPIIAGIGYKTTPSKTNARGFRSLAQIRNRSAAGAIYETAGRKNPTGSSRSKSRNPNAGKQFIEALEPLEGTGKERGRLIYKAWENDHGAAQDGVIHAIMKADKLFKARLADF